MSQVPWHPAISLCHHHRVIAIHLQTLLTVTWQRTSQDFLRSSSVDFSRCSVPSRDWYNDVLGMSTSHRRCETFTGCGLWMHWFQVGCAHLPMSAWSDAMVSFQLHPVCRRFQPPTSPVIIILAAGDPTYTAVHCCRSCVSSGWKPPLEQSATRHHRISNADCFSEPPQNLSLFPIVSFLFAVSSSVHRV